MLTCRKKYTSWRWRMTEWNRQSPSGGTSTLLSEQIAGDLNENLDLTYLLYLPCIHDQVGKEWFFQQVGGCQKVHSKCLRAQLICRELPTMWYSKTNSVPTLWDLFGFLPFFYAFLEMLCEWQNDSIGETLCFVVLLIFHKWKQPTMQRQDQLQFCVHLSICLLNDGDFHFCSKSTGNVTQAPYCMCFFSWSNSRCTAFVMMGFICMHLSKNTSMLAMSTWGREVCCFLLGPASPCTQKTRRKSCRNA